MDVDDDSVQPNVQDVDDEMDGINSSAFPESPLTAAYVSKQVSKALGNKYHMSKEAKAGVENAAQVFLMMISSVSSDYAGRHKRRHVVQKSDVREALGKLNLSHLTDPVDNSNPGADTDFRNHTMHSSVKEKKTVKHTKPRSNPYCNFIKQEMPKLKLVFPEYNLGSLAKEAAKKWKELSGEEKNAFRE